MTMGSSMVTVAHYRKGEREGEGSRQAADHLTKGHVYVCLALCVCVCAQGCDILAPVMREHLLLHSFLSPAIAGLHWRSL